KQDLEKTFSEFDARIEALEAQLGTTPATDQAIRPDPKADGTAPATAGGKAKTPATTGSVSVASPSAKGGPGTANAAAAKMRAANPADMPSNAPAQNKRSDYEKWGPFDPDVGVILATGPLGEVSFGVRGYVRYINQAALAPTYTDSFGRTFIID